MKVSLKVCSFCKKEFICNHKNRIYCSKSCQQLNYYYRHKKEVNTRNRKWKQTHFEYIRKCRQERYRKRKKKCLDLIGNKCVICDYKKNICFHEKYGKPHKYRTLKYTVEHYLDFVSLCRKCHNGLHLFGDKKIKEEEFLRLLRLLFKS